MTNFFLLIGFQTLYIILSFNSNRELSGRMLKLSNLNRQRSTRDRIRELKLYTSTSFYDSIGSPKFISAPMVDQSNLAWRILVRKNGADLAFAQMMHARNFVNDKKYRADCIDWDDCSGADSEQECIVSGGLDRPLIVQLAGDDPDILVKAGRLIHHDVTAIDLNLGCPQRIAKKGHYGAYLLPEKTLVLSCLSAMVKGLDCPVTAKIRRLPSDEETIELCQEMEKCGVQMITVHGRTADSNKLFIGPAGEYTL
jgi:tRNA-dihydrouridine synthase 1